VASQVSEQVFQSNSRKEIKTMSIGLVLIIILAVMLFGGFNGRFGGYGYGYGHRGVGLIGIALAVIVVLALTNQI
jgi:hypothetical protein